MPLLNGSQVFAGIYESVGLSRRGQRRNRQGHVGSDSFSGVRTSGSHQVGDESDFDDQKELDERVDDFASLVRVLDNYSTKSIVELTNGVKTLTKSFDGVTDKAFKTTKDLNNCISEFSEVAGRLQGDINGIVDNLLPGMHEIKNSADIIQNVAETSSRQIIEASENIKSYGSVSEENFNLVFEKIEAQSKYLENITEKSRGEHQNGQRNFPFGLF